MELKLSSCSTGCKVISRKATDVRFIKKDTPVLEYSQSEDDGSTSKHILKATSDGIITFKENIVPGLALDTTVVIAIMTDCTHQIVMKDMCATCGKDLRAKDGFAGQRVEKTTANVSMIHHVPELIVSHDLAKSFGSKDQQYLLASRKLVLLVDLDQTIIHTTNGKFDKEQNKNGDVTTYKLGGGKGYTYHTKLRPHTKQFLLNLSKLYEMHVITFGQRMYAHRIAKMIDPNESLFGQRILSREESFSAHHKTHNLKALFPNGDQLIAIIDDRADVWQYSEALIQVKPYRFFKEVGDINAPKNSNAEAMLPVDIVENDEDDRTLEYIEKVLTNIHTNFYKHYDSTGEIRDLKIVISWLKKQVLRNEVFVLTGLVPLEQKPEQSDIYRLCTQFGAKIVNKVTKEVTVVIAGRWGTTKVHEAETLKIPVVVSHWLYSCVEKWEKADVADFILTKDTVLPPGAPLGGRIIPELTSIDTMKKAVLADMASEVDDALSDESDSEGDEEKNQERKEEDEEEDVEEPAELQEARNSIEEGLFGRKRLVGEEDEDDGETLEDEAELRGDDLLVKKRRTDDDTYQPENERVDEEDDIDARDDIDYDGNGDSEMNREEEWTRDGLEEEDIDDEEVDDMVALVERQMSGEE